MTKTLPKDAVIEPFELDPNPYSEENINHFNGMLTHLAEHDKEYLAGNYLPLMELVIIGYHTVKERQGSVTPSKVAKMAGWYGITGLGSANNLVMMQGDKVMLATWGTPKPLADRQMQADETARAIDKAKGVVAAKDMPLEEPQPTPPETPSPKPFEPDPAIKTFMPPPNPLLDSKTEFVPLGPTPKLFVEKKKP